jgi:hypothetical protein
VDEGDEVDEVSMLRGPMGDDAGNGDEGGNGGSQNGKAARRKPG